MRTVTLSPETARRSLALGDGLRRVSLATLAVAGLTLVALFLRLYQLEPFAYVPDQYERLADAQRMLSGRLPQSQIYPPGAALLLVLPVALLSASIPAGQVATAAFGILLVPLAYAGVTRLTGDRRAALILAGFCALSPRLILYARSGHVDIFVTFLVVLAVFLVPVLRGRSLLAFAAYGFLLALLVNIRVSNAALLPCVALYWLLLAGGGPRPSAILREVASAPALAATASFAFFCVLSAAAGQWFGNNAGASVSFEHLLPNLADYAAYVFGDWLAVLTFPPAIAGAATLWRVNRPLLGAITWLLIVWPLVHAPFPFNDGRYMTPLLFFVLLLTAVGFSSLLRLRTSLPTLAAAGVHTYAGFTLAALALLLSVNAALIPGWWHDNAAQSDAGLAAEIRPVLDGLGPDALLVSSVTRALADVEPQPRFVDLFDQSLAHPDRTEGAALTAALVRDTLASGANVYYLYTHMEADDLRIGGAFDDHNLYFEAIRTEFTVTEIYRTEALRNGSNPWVLYQLSP